MRALGETLFTLIGEKPPSPFLRAMPATGS